MHPRLSVNRGVGRMSEPTFISGGQSIAQCPANTKCSANGGLMLVQRRRRWTNITPTLAQRFVLAG